MLKRESGLPMPAGNRLDLAAAFAGKGEELFDRQRVRDPFRQALGANRLIFKMLDHVHAAVPPKHDFLRACIVRQEA
jgi:hypothetical protein